MKGLVSFCIFGPGTSGGTDGHKQGYSGPRDIYYGGAVKNALLYREWQPNWDLRFYLGGSIPRSVTDELEVANPNTQFVWVDQPEDQKATWWRMNAIKDAWGYDFILFRDVDSRPSLREKTAVEEFLDSSFSYHMMRDHRYHGRQLMSGMWGVKRDSFAELQHLPWYLDQDFYGTDQIALLMMVWPTCRRKILSHIGCYNIYEKVSQRRPFRVPRDPGSFVAQGLYADDTVRYPEHATEIESDVELLASPDIFAEEYRCVPKPV